MSEQLLVAFPTGNALAVYRDPVDVVRITADDAIPGAFQRLDEALRNGYTIAGYATYEFGAALSGVPFVDNGDPLLAIGIYKGSRNLRGAPTSLRLPPTVALSAWAQYEAAFDAIKELLYEGDAYQVNLTVPFAFPFVQDTREAFALLARSTGAPYAAYVEHGPRAFASLSPELFLGFDGDTLVSRPMKGTATPEAADGLQSEKNRAEHTMIVDLVRNDLHRVCTDVVVDDIFTEERYPTFVTMTATIRGTLRANVPLLDIFAATFPCGSITGAPKLSAMRAIANLEKTPRGIAMGTIGYLEPERRGWWNVAIRTIAFDGRSQRAELRIGGGIVADSKPADEWAEILVKRRSFAEVTDDVELIETMLFENGLLNRELHLKRLAASANAFGIITTPAELERSTQDYVESLGAVQRCVVRMVLYGRGSITYERRTLEPAPADATVCLTPARVRATDPLLRYKTTRRGCYDAASRFARRMGCWEGLLQNERGEIADGSRTTLFVLANRVLLTPPLESGALAGLLRGQLLASGVAAEAVLTPEALSGAEAIWVGNIVRGLVRCSFVPVVRS